MLRILRLYAGTEDADDHPLGRAMAVGYRYPTETQLQALPHGFAGEDCVIQAQAGTSTCPRHRLLPGSASKDSSSQGRDEVARILGVPAGSCQLSDRERKRETIASSHMCFADGVGQDRGLSPPPAGFHQR